MTSKKEMTQLTALATQQQTCQEAIQQAEETVKQCKEAYRDIAENQLPELMNSLRLAKFTTDNGLTIEKRSNVHAAISKERMPKAVAWLRKHGHAQIVKHTFTVRAKDDKEAVRLEKALAKYEGMAAAPKVNPMTLKAWAKEMLATGANIDMDLFGVYVRDVAVVKTV